MKSYLLLLITLTLSAQGYAQDMRLNPIASQYLKAYKVPGLAVSVIRGDSVWYGVAGVKKVGASASVDLGSKFQLASNAKAITAMVAAKLVEEKKIAWESTIPEIVPELRGKIKPAYETVTLQDLLSNRGKVQPFEDDGSKEWKGLPKSLATSSDSKLAFAEYALGLNPKIDPENNHSYSNGGFVIAGLLLEKCSGKTWPELVEKLNHNFGTELSVGFPHQDPVDGTYGHEKKAGRYRAVGPEDEYSFGFDFSPAGNLSVGIEDLTKIMELNLRGLLGEDNVLSSETYEKLHYGFDDYALGWYNGNIGETDQRFSYHGGSLGTYSSAVMLSADRKTAILILVNSDDKKTTELKNKLRTELWTKYGREPE